MGQVLHFKIVSLHSGLYMRTSERGEQWWTSIPFRKRKHSLLPPATESSDAQWPLVLFNLTPIGIKRTWFLTNTVHQPQDWVFSKAPIRGAVLRSWIRNFPLHQQRVSWGINGYHTTGQTPLMEEHPFCTSGFFSFLKVTYQSWVAPNC